MRIHHVMLWWLLVSAAFGAGLPMTVHGSVKSETENRVLLRFTPDTGVRHTYGVLKDFEARQYQRDQKRVRPMLVSWFAHSSLEQDITLSIRVRLLDTLAVTHRSSTWVSMLDAGDLRCIDSASVQYHACSIAPTMSAGVDSAGKCRTSGLAWAFRSYLPWGIEYPEERLAIGSTWTRVYSDTIAIAIKKLTRVDEHRVTFRLDSIGAFGRDTCAYISAAVKRSIVPSSEKGFVELSGLIEGAGAIAYIVRLRDGLIVSCVGHTEAEGWQYFKGMDDMKVEPYYEKQVAEYHLLQE
jgi:hypothetical protein